MHRLLTASIKLSMAEIRTQGHQNRYPTRKVLVIDYKDLGKYVSELEAAAASSKKANTVTAAATTTPTSTATGLQKDDSQPVVTATVEAP